MVWFLGKGNAADVSNSHSSTATGLPENGKGNEEACLNYSRRIQRNISRDCTRWYFPLVIVVLDDERADPAEWVLYASCDERDHFVVAACDIGSIRFENVLVEPAVPSGSM